MSPGTIEALYFTVMGALFGAIVGSWMTAVAHRLPRRLPLNGRSACPSCETQIKAHHNLPVFGWLLLRGRCAACRQAIPVRYPLIELAFAIAFAVIFLWDVRVGLVAVAALIVGPLLISLFQRKAVSE